MGGAVCSLIRAIRFFRGSTGDCPNWILERILCALSCPLYNRSLILGLPRITLVGHFPEYQTAFLQPVHAENVAMGGFACLMDEHERANNAEKLLPFIPMHFRALNPLPTNTNSTNAPFGCRKIRQGNMPTMNSGTHCTSPQKTKKPIFSLGLHVPRKERISANCLWEVLTTLKAASLAPSLFRPIDQTTAEASNQGGIVAGKSMLYPSLPYMFWTITDLVRLSTQGYRNRLNVIADCSALHA